MKHPQIIHFRFSDGILFGYKNPAHRPRHPGDRDVFHQEAGRPFLGTARVLDFCWSAILQKDPLFEGIYRV